MSEGPIGWIGVDFDGTLATYGHGQLTKLGKPIAPMVARVKAWLAAGWEVRVVTARVSSRNEDARLQNGEHMWKSEDHRAAIKAWCKEHIGQELPVTAEKDFLMKQLWDDRAVTVEFNTGRLLTGEAKVYGLKMDGNHEWCLVRSKSLS